MAEWIDAGARAELEAKGKRLLKAAGKQILLIARGSEIFACNNRCPHEGYPLSEGTLSGVCTLTCNWHNWKFDLSSGETLVGGDRLRRYPVEDRGGRLFVDVADPPAAERQARALANLAEAGEDNDYARMAREIARFVKADGDPLEPLRRTIHARAAHFEFGMTHAYAAAADWIALHDTARTQEQRLTALVEPVAHIAWDTLREGEYPFTDEAAPWHADRFVAAIEEEDEPAAIAMLNDALGYGPSVAPDLKRAFARAALAHYQDFGHSAIYTRKAFELVARLGWPVAAPVLRSLARSLVYATREDRIPEFRHYPKALREWGSAKLAAAEPQDLVGLSVNQTLDRTAALPADNLAKYRTMLEASALAMKRYDLSVGWQTLKPVSHNVHWLDFTHMLTFANAVRELCTETPALWPQALLQMACFLGRNAPFLRPDADTAFEVTDAAAFFAGEREALYDHGIREPIYACHRVKVLTAVAEETAWAGGGSLTQNLLAATNRYLHTPLKYHHGLRDAHQALSFVEAEG
jgi:nitrite reductase/ring-hydroxylating ferredoxin subunit